MELTLEGDAAPYDQGGHQNISIVGPMGAFFVSLVS